MAGGLLRGTEFLVAEASPDDVFTPEDFTEEQRQLGTMAEQFARDEVMPRAERIEKQEFALVVELLRACGQLGLLAIDAPEAFGGLDLDKATSMIAAEKLGWTGSWSVAYMAHSGIATLPLVYYGTKEQNERYLTKIVSGEWAGAYCLTEPGSGSDALGARTTARLSADGRHYLLDGTKQFITNGAFADLFTVFAKVDGKHFTAFLVERGFEGVTIGAEEKKLGIKGSSTTQVIFEGARVPVENVLGEVGKGHKIAFNVLNVGRFKLGASSVGCMKADLAGGLAYANLRKQFGVPVSSFGAVREKVADMAADLFASEALVYRLAGLIDGRLALIPRGGPDYYERYQAAIEEYAAECAIAKVYCTEALAYVADEVIQIHGGYGFTQEYAAERYYRDERVNRIFEGTNEINRLLVPTNFFRRAAKEEIALRAEAERARAALTGGEGAPPPGPYGDERALLRRAKQGYLLLAGAAAQRFRDRLKDEQEVLLALADVAIQAFALESVLLRAERIRGRLAESRRPVLDAVVAVAAARAADELGRAARRGAAYVAEDGSLLAALRRCAEHAPRGLLAAKRALAAACLEGERYPF